MIDRIQGPLDNQLYYTNYVGNQDISAMWHPTANLNEPPYQYIGTPIYQGCTPNYSVQPEVSILRDRWHPQRWYNTIELYYHNVFQMPYNGHLYFNSGIGVKRLLSGNSWLPSCSQHLHLPSLPVVQPTPPFDSETIRDAMASTMGLMMAVTSLCSRYLLQPPLFTP